MDKIVLLLIIIGLVILYLYQEYRLLLRIQAKLDASIKYLEQHLLQEFSCIESLLYYVVDETPSDDIVLDVRKKIQSFKTQTNDRSERIKLANEIHDILNDISMLIPDARTINADSMRADMCLTRIKASKSHLLIAKHKCNDVISVYNKVLSLPGNFMVSIVLAKTANKNKFSKRNYLLYQKKPLFK